MPFSTPRTQELFANATVAVGVIPAVLGVNAILRPASALAIFQFPPPAEAEGRRLAHSLARIYGGRNLAFGLMTLLVWARGDRRTLGLAVLLSTPMALVDGWVSHQQIGRGEWNHWIFVGVGAGLAAGVLGWF